MKKEFDRKVRTVVRGISVFMKSLPLLNPFKYGLFSWQLFSHKLCRWLVPFAMIIAFLSNLILILRLFLNLNLSLSLRYLSLCLFIFQAVFYVLAFGGIWGEPFYWEKLFEDSFVFCACQSIHFECLD